MNDLVKSSIIEVIKNTKNRVECLVMDTEFRDRKLIDNIKSRNPVIIIESIEEYVKFYRINRFKVGNFNTSKFISEVSTDWIVNDYSSDSTVVEKFASLNKKISIEMEKHGVTRSVLSLTSKILWSVDPTNCPIYDRRANDSVEKYSLLFKLIEKNTYEEIAEPKKLKTDIDKFNNYYYKYTYLYKLFSRNFDKKDTYESSRYFDKLLWLLGG